MKPDDTLTRHGAGALAAQIERFWQMRGLTIRAIAEPLPHSPEHWQVRSNLVNGLPRGITAARL